MTSESVFSSFYRMQSHDYTRAFAMSRERTATADITQMLLQPENGFTQQMQNRQGQVELEDVDVARDSGLTSEVTKLADRLSQVEQKLDALPELLADAIKRA